MTKITDPPGISTSIDPRIHSADDDVGAASGLAEFLDSLIDVAIGLLRRGFWWAAVYDLTAWRAMVDAEDSGE